MRDIAEIIKDEGRGSFFGDLLNIIASGSFVDKGGNPGPGCQVVAFLTPLEKALLSMIYVHIDEVNRLIGTMNRLIDLHQQSSEYYIMAEKDNIANQTLVRSLIGSLVIIIQKRLNMDIFGVYGFCSDFRMIKIADSVDGASDERLISSGSLFSFGFLKAPDGGVGNVAPDVFFSPN